MSDGDIEAVIQCFEDGSLPRSEWTHARHRRHEARPMTVLEQTASVVFVSILIPGLMLASMCVAFLIICNVMGPPNTH
jgi:hypothetical protein